MPPERQIPVLVVFGPTASGKTDLADSLFSKNSRALPSLGEVISADSMQVYRRMNIGTAKPDAALLAELPHHLLDIRDPDEHFSAADFVHLADLAADDIYRRGKLPVLMGGTAFYIKNFMYGLPDTPVSDALVRDGLKTRLSQEGSVALWHELRAIDPVSAARIHENDGYRVTRALEVFSVSGKPLSSFALCDRLRDQYRFLVIGIDRLRDELNARIEQRVFQMFAAGLENEFRCLVEAGYGQSCSGMQAIGYREFFENKSSSETAQLIIQHTRLYAKRQLTFFRSLSDVHWFGAGETEAVSQIVRDFSGSLVLDGLS